MNEKKYNYHDHVQRHKTQSWQELLLYHHTIGNAPLSRGTKISKPCKNRIQLTLYISSVHGWSWTMMNAQNSLPCLFKL